MRSPPRTPRQEHGVEDEQWRLHPSSLETDPNGDQTGSHGQSLGYLALHKSLAQMLGVVNAAGTGLGHGVRYETQSLVDMRSRTTYALSGDLINLYDGVDWFFPGLSSPWSLNLQKTHIDLHCNVIRSQHANGQRLWTHVKSPPGGGTLTPAMRSYIPLAKRELNKIRVWIPETGTDTKVTLPTHQKTRITPHFRKTL